MWVSDMMPCLSEKVDELCFLRALQTDSPAHPGAIRLFQSGSLQFVRPSLGSWILYGLGTENQNLPGFVVISPMLYGDDGSTLDFSNVFLPAVYQGTDMRIDGVSIQNLDRHESISASAQRLLLDHVNTWNRQHQKTRPGDSRLDGRIASYELAARMQLAAPEALDLSRETMAVRNLYGIDDKPTATFGRQCLTARRLIERGVRFVQVWSGAGGPSNNWDNHTNIRTELPAIAASTDRPVAALLADLKQRGLLEDTLLIWNTEFGRHPFSQGADGRDHNGQGFSTWLAGGGIKAGISHGATDELGYHAVEDVVSVHDLHATMLYLLGIDHTRLTFKFLGRDFRLTDVRGEVVKQILA
jgi:hypothetical protein